MMPVSASAVRVTLGVTPQPLLPSACLCTPQKYNQRLPDRSPSLRVSIIVPALFTRSQHVSLSLVVKLQPTQGRQWLKSCSSTLEPAFLSAVTHTFNYFTELSWVSYLLSSVRPLCLRSLPLPQPLICQTVMLWTNNQVWNNWPVVLPSAVIRVIGVEPLPGHAIGIKYQTNVAMIIHRRGIAPKINWAGLVVIAFRSDQLVAKTHIWKNVVKESLSDLMVN